MKMSCINVGYGDALLLEGEQNCLIDTGSGQEDEYSSSAVRISADAYLSLRKIRKIDHLILTHIHEDHVGNLESLKPYIRDGRVYVPEGFREIRGVENPESGLPFKKESTRLFYRGLVEFSGLMQAAEHGFCEVIEVKEGERLRIDRLMLKALKTKKEPRLRFIRLVRHLKEIADPEEYVTVLEELDALSNATALLLKLSCGDSFHGLFCSDNVPSNWVVDEEFRREVSDVSFLKLSHHGQRDSIDREKMQEMPLRICLTTASSDKRYDSSNEFVYRSLSEIAEQHGREIKFLFSDPSPSESFWKGERGYQAIEFELDKTDTYKLIFKGEKV